VTAAAPARTSWSRRLSAVAAAGLVLAAGCGSDDLRTDVDRDIEVFGPYQNEEADRFEEVLEQFERDTGIGVRYVGSSDFVADLRQRAGVGRNPPDVAMVPQLGVIRQLIDDGMLAPLTAETQQVVLDDFLISAALFGESEMSEYTVPFRVAFKSLVWYRPSVFEEHGWTPPVTLDELHDLVDRIQEEDDITPWCFGIEAGSATGWPATDWTEDLVLRRLGVDAYQRWATGSLDFADPEIEAVFEELRELVLASGRTEGGVTGIIEMPVDEALGPLFDDPPGCALYKQADFAVGWMPDGTTIGADGTVDFFPLPAEEDGGGIPVLAGADHAVQFRSTPEIDRLMAYLATPEAAETWIRHGGFLSPNETVPDDAYPEDYLLALATVLGSASELAYDASDQMPPSIGSDLLWDQITRWIAGVDTYPVFAATIDDAWARYDADRAAGASATAATTSTTEVDGS
jgi:alpha-glucoside transport system substrate-binding protein